MHGWGVYSIGSVMDAWVGRGCLQLKAYILTSHVLVLFLYLFTRLYKIADYYMI